MTAEIAVINPRTGQADYAISPLSPDDLAELGHRVAGCDIPASHLMAEGNALAGGDAFGRHRILVDLLCRDDDIVVGRQAQDANPDQGLAHGAKRSTGSTHRRGASVRAAVLAELV